MHWKDLFKNQNHLTAKSATTNLISCMGFRLIDDTCRFMDRIGSSNNYDQFILLGASLKFNQTKYHHWT